MICLQETQIQSQHCMIPENQLGMIPDLREAPEHCRVRHKTEKEK